MLYVHTHTHTDYHYVVYTVCVCVCVCVCLTVYVVLYFLQKTGNPSAQLTQQEIQAGIDRANVQTQEAIECKYLLTTLCPVLPMGIAL